MKTKIILLIAFALALSINMFSQKTYTLDECKKMAIANNITVKNGKLNVQSAEQTTKEGYTKFFPEVKASAFGFNNSRSFVSMDFGGLQVNMLKSGTTAGVTAIQPLYEGGKISNGYKLAQLGEDVTKNQQQVTTNGVVLETEDIYWQLASLVSKLNTIQFIENELQSILKKAETSAKAETGLQNEVLKVKLKINETEAQKSKIINAITLCKMNLCHDMGLSVDSAKNIAINIPDFNNIEAPNTYYVEHEKAVKTRPEYKLLEESVSANKLESKIKLGDYLPSVAFGANYGYDNFTKNNSMSGVVFVSVSIPISDWWGGSYAMKKQKIKEDIAYNQYQDGKQMLLLEMKQAQNDFDESYSQVQVAQSAITQATENLRLNKNYLNAETADISQVLDAESMLAQSKSDYIDACISYYMHKAKYLQVTGGSADI